VSILFTQVRKPPALPARFKRPIDAPAHRLVPFLILGLTTIAVGACEAAWPAWRTLMPQSDFGRLILDVYEDILWWTLGIFVVVELLLLFAVLRYRRRPGDTGEPEQVHGYTALELGWTFVPAAILFFIAIPTVRTIFQTQSDGLPQEDPLEIRVTGHQWWWEFEYPGLGVVTANELHLPRGRTANLSLTSADVIHSFWIPRLGGKRDVNPGEENHIWFTPDSAGEFEGQCAEFCGLSHANMRMKVVVDEPDAFERWVAAMNEPVPVDSVGFMTFLVSGCAACHAIAGTPAQGKVGPVLSDVGRRTTIAAGLLPNTPAHMAGWLRDPDSVKPGALMPDLNLSEARIDSLVSFLHSLR
jgi:cytochrome c oxidase subunit 2